MAEMPKLPGNLTWNVSVVRDTELDTVRITAYPQYRFGIEIVRDNRYPPIIVYLSGKSTIEDMKEAISTEAQRVLDDYNTMQKESEELKEWANG